MRNRHLRYFLAVAEEQSFSRAAAKLHIDASPLARAIGDLEAQLGTQLLIREKGHIRLTNSGEVFREEARRILTSIENAKIRVRSATNGYRGQLRVGLADSLAQPQLTVNDMILAIRHGEIDVGFTMDGEFSEGLFKSALWRERAVVAMPTRHPFLALDRVSSLKPFATLWSCPTPINAAVGIKQYSNGLTTSVSRPRTVAEYISAHVPMMMLVGAGYGTGIGLESQLAFYSHPNIVVRVMMMDEVPPVATYIVKPIDRSRAIYKPSKTDRRHHHKCL